MTTIRTLQRSFAGGEITPELYGRVDLDKYQTGLAQALNFLILPHGPATTRPGLEFINEAKLSSKAVRLIPFAYSTAQTYALELGEYYLRVHTQGGTLLEAAQDLTGATRANPCVITVLSHGYTAGQWVYLAGVGGMTQLNGRFFQVGTTTTDTFQLLDAAGGNINAVDYATYTSGGAVSRVYEVSTPYSATDLDALQYVQSADVMTLVHPSHPVKELRRSGATSWALTDVSFLPAVLPPTDVAATATRASSAGDAGDDTTDHYIVTTVAENLEESEASASTSCVNRLWLAGSNYNTISWTAATGAKRYNVYKKQGGVYGYIGQASGTSFVDDNILPDMSLIPPEYSDPFSGADNYPSACAYFEQRRVFASTNNKPQHLWMTRSGTESNMGGSLPVRDDDAIAIRIASREVNKIRHIVPLSDLLLLTSGGEWRVQAANSDVITPLTIAIRPSAYVGASQVQPVTAANTVLYVQDLGGRVRELAYKWESSGYTSIDVSILAPHLFDGYTITGLAYTRAPLQVLWAVRSDGVLLGMTYVPEHKIIAWHQHTTAGYFESLCAVAEDAQDALYAVVRRTINGRAVRYIERMHVREFTTLADAFHVDAGDTYDGAAVTTITGLHHLEGETVKVLADGAVHPDVVVSGGSITLEKAASKVQVGLGYTADLQTLPLSFEAQAAGQGLRKNINRAYLRVYRSSGVAAGPAFDALTEYAQRTTEHYGTPPDLRTDELALLVNPAWGADAQLCVRQANPLPLTVVSLSLEVAVGG